MPGITHSECKRGRAAPTTVMGWDVGDKFTDVWPVVRHNLVPLGTIDDSARRLDSPGSMLRLLSALVPALCSAMRRNFITVEAAGIDDEGRVFVAVCTGFSSAHSCPRCCSLRRCPSCGGVCGGDDSSRWLGGASLSRRILSLSFVAPALCVEKARPAQHLQEAFAAHRNRFSPALGMTCRQSGKTLSTRRMTSFTLGGYRQSVQDSEREPLPMRVPGGGSFNR